MTVDHPPLPAPRRSVAQNVAAAVAVVTVVTGTGLAVRAFRSLHYFEWLWPAVALVTFVVLATLGFQAHALVTTIGEDRPRFNNKIRSLATIVAWFAISTALIGIPALIGVTASPGRLVGETGTIVALTALIVPILLTGLWFALRWSGSTVHQRWQLLRSTAKVCTRLYVIAAVLGVATIGGMFLLEAPAEVILYTSMVVLLAPQPLVWLAVVLRSRTRVLAKDSLWLWQQPLPAGRGKTDLSMVGRMDTDGT